MRNVARLSALFGNLFRRSRRDRELDEELQGCLGELVDRYVSEGRSHPEALRLALLEIGGLEQVKSDVRHERAGGGLLSALADVRFALRILARDRSFTVTAVLVLALGLGVNVTLFTIVNAFCLRDLPFPESTRLLHVSTIDKSREHGLSLAELEALGSEPAIESAAGFLNVPLDVAESGRPAARVQGSYVSGRAFTLLREEARLGRVLTREDDRAGALPVAVIGERLWTTRYSAHPGVLGRTLRIGDDAVVIVGVMGEGFEFPAATDVWLPLSLAPATSRAPSARALGVFARAAATATPEASGLAIAARVERVARSGPGASTTIAARVMPLADRFRGRLTDPAWLAFFTVGVVVLLIASANVGNLMLAWSSHRVREVAIRSAMGASRFRIVRQLVLENTLLGVIGGIAGLGVAQVLVRLFASAVPERVLPYWVDFSMDGRVLAVLAATSLATVLVFGLVPARRVSAFDVNRALKDDGPGSVPRGTHRWTTAFLAVQFALTLLLVAHVALGWRVDAPPPEAEQAVERSGAASAALELPATRYPDPVYRLAFVERVRSALEASGAFEATGLTSALPLQGGTEQSLEIEGRSPAAPDRRPAVRSVAITPGYFETFQLSVIRGRDFSNDDGAAGREAVIINQRFADLHFRGEDPLGRRLRLTQGAGPQSATTPWLTVVGVAPTIRQRRTAVSDPVAFLPFRTVAPAAMTIVFRSPDDAAALAVVRERVTAIDSRLPVFRVASVRQVLADAQWNGRVSAGLIRGISAVALCLAVIGLYAATAHATAQRRRELAIRMALGARRRHIRHAVLTAGLRQIVVGLVVGLLCTLAWEAAFYSGQAGLRLSDWRVLVPATLVLALVAVVACLVPAARAARIDPLAVLRRT
jgi:putative ABC transport system permease protein